MFGDLFTVTEKHCREGIVTKQQCNEDRVGITFDLPDFQPPSGYRPGSGHHGHQKSFSSTRAAYHRGHKIKIKTTYRIEIDDEPLTLHTMVLDDGTVHCHGLPNYVFPSAIDLAKSIIDAARLAHYEIDELSHRYDERDRHGGDHHGAHGASQEGDH